MSAKKKTAKTVDKFPRAITVLLACITIFLTMVLWLLSAKKLTDSGVLLSRGTLDATVNYLGKDCSKEKIKKVPPCSGPYANYFVRIFGKKNSVVIAANLTDSLGKVLVNLPAGDYYFLSRELDKDGKPYRADFTIRANKRTYKNFVIDLSAR